MAEYDTRQLSTGLIHPGPVIWYIKERRLMTEREIDQEYLGKWVLCDRRNVPAGHSAGYPVAYGDSTEEVWEALEELGIKEYGGKAMLQLGVAERGVCHSQFFDNQ